MQSPLTIGEFSRATHLSVKTLRHYHEVGLLLPAEVDSDSGYRYYVTAQVPTAQVIRRFRDLDMPVEEVRSVLTAPDIAARNALIAAHLRRMEDQLEQTQAAVASLRSLVEGSQAPITVEHRATPATRAMAISETVTLTDLLGWWTAAFAEVHAVLRGSELEATGPAGALFSDELFADEVGDVVVFVPTDLQTPTTGRARSIVLPPAELAVTMHHGRHADIDRAYGALATYVTEHALGVEGPVRENYLVSRLDTPDETQWETEIGWPIFSTAHP
jgi:DNA-binding transcriptional MerR regulator